MTPEQKKAIALANARKRKAEAVKQSAPEQEAIQMKPLGYPIIKGTTGFEGMEALASIATGAGASIAGGIRGIAELDPLDYMNPPTYKDVERASNAIKETQEALTYKPRTEGGQSALKAIGQAAEPVTEQFEKAETELGEMGYKQHGPMGGAIASTLPTAYTMVMGPAISKVGQGIKSQASQAMLKKRMQFTQELVSPKKTTKIKVEEAKREVETGRIFKSTKTVPTKQEVAMAEEVAKIPTVSPSKSIHRNLVAANEAKRQLFADIGSKLDDIDDIIPRSQAMADPGTAVRKALDENPILVGSEKMANKFAAQAREIIAKHPETARGLWEARKEFDAFAQSQRANIFKTEQEPAVKVVVREIRDSINNRIASVAPQYADDMTRGSNLLNATDNMADKAAMTSKNAIIRGLDNVGQVIGTRNQLMQGLAVLTGTSVLGAATAFAPLASAVVGTGAAVYLGGKLITKPQIRMAMGETIKTMGIAIGQAKDSRIVSQLKADRAALIETLQLLQDEEQ